MRRVVKSVILIVFPIVLNSLSLPSARIEGENIVPLDTIKLIAYQNAKALWGAVAMSPPIPYCDMDGNIRAYGFTFAIEKGSFPTYDQILDEIEESKDKWMVEDYASMLISARYDKPPIIRYGRGLGVYYARGERAKNKAIKVLNTTEVKLTRIYYAAPYIVWFEFVSPQGKLMVNPYSLTIKTAEEFEKIRYKVKEKERKRINEPTYKEWLEHIKEQWKRFQRGETLSKSDHFMPDYEMVPYYDWHYGCTPTAAAMVLGFYDNNYTVYGNLIWHFFEAWDRIEWETDYHVADAQKWLAVCMGTDTVETGGTSSDSVEPGIEEYTNEWCGYSFDVVQNYYWYPPWAWDEIVNEINNNRPVLWGYFIGEWGHTVTIVGYTDDDYLIIHNTWWMGLDYLDIYELDEAYLRRVYPGGGYGFDVKLEEPCGGMGLWGDPYDENGCYVVWRAGGYAVIEWDNHGYTGGYVDIYLSIEGGRPGTWDYQFTTENDGEVWVSISPDATPTTSARIMILGTTSTKEVTEDSTFVIGVKGGSQHLNIRTPMFKNEKSLVSGDGSYGSFQIKGNTDPELTYPNVDPDEGTPNTDFYYYVHYYDADGDAPSVIKVYIDGEGYDMELYSGSASNGTYRYGPHHFGSGSHSHSYYFYCEDGYGGSDETDTYYGPTTNTYPELTDGDVTPDEGTPDTDFYYYLHYYDADGDAPSVIKVYIDGEGHNMTLYSGSASNGTYRYGPHHFEPGSHSHSYYFYCEDDYGGTDRLPSSGSYSGPTTNTYPELTNGYVTPDEGTPDTDFYYYLHYYDADGDAPSVIKVYIDGEGHNMTLYSGSASNGTYRYGPHHFEPGSHSHSYYFYCEDGHGGTDRLPSSGSYSGPTTNTYPELSSGDVTPDEGTTEDTFRYTVHYYDADGDAPDTKWVYIDGSPHTMILYSGSASNGWYEYETTLGVGSHDYYFYFTDGYGGSYRLPSSGTYPGPNVEQPNTDPELTDGYVTPDEGTPDTDFYYYVDYYDADGDTPSVIKVYIDGEGYDMTLYSDSASNGTYRYGPHHFEPGSHSHSYYFYCEDGRGGTDSLPETGSYSGPTTNTCPELTYPDVDPDEGTPDTDFYYSVHYYDADGDAPSVIKVYIDGEGHNMTLYSGSASNGTYRYGPHHFGPSSHSHSFNFYVSDGYCEIRLPSSGSYSGPFINTPPELSEGDVTPDEGTTEDTFRYTVHYYDADGDAPDTKWVYIDGSPHTMSLYSGSASNGWYEYKTTLGVGSHNYYFYFTDGYGGSDTLPSTGTYSGPNVEQPAGYEIEGDLCYYSNDATIYPAIVYLMGNASDSIWVDENGHYMFEDLAGGLDYCVKPYKEDDDRAAISPFDASYVLRFYVNALTLDPYQRIAADVTGNGDITPFDASYILRYYVGIIDTFPVGSWKFVPEAFSIDTTNWTYAPDSICYPDLNTDYTNENYRGILYGDVTGNWAAGQIASLHKGSKNNEIIGMPDKLFAVPGDTIEVPFTLSEGEANAFSLGLVIEYDPQIIEVISVNKTSLTKDWLMSHCAKNGILRIGLAGARSIKKGIPLKIKFHVKKSQTSPIETKIKLVEVQVNENCINDLVSTRLTISEELARFYKLSESYPNPFSTYTMIEYFLPTKSRVTLTIYNIAGEVMKVLVNELQKAGTYRVYWDGTNEEGRRLPNGIYFYELQTQEFRACKKCVIIR